MSDLDLLAQRFDANREHLRAVAFRMLGSAPDADDAVQEAWLRVSRADTERVSNLGGWLTTVVSRVCLDMLRARRSRGEDSLDDREPEPATGAVRAPTPEEDAVLADSVGMAMLLVLEKLAPAERVAFVLHDMFDLTFDEIAPIVGRSAVATRQLASRARRRVRGGSPVGGADRTRQQQVVERFLAASRAGDIAGLIAVLDPEVVLRGDETATKLARGTLEVVGAAAVAEQFKGQARAAIPGLIDGEMGVHVPIRGRMLLVLQLAFADDGRIASIDAVADRATLETLALVPLAEPLA